VIVSPALLQVQDLELHFGGVYAIQGLSLDVDPEEMIGIIGPNGAGKTTLLNCISGVYRPTSGRVIFDGNKIDGLPAHKTAGRGIARTFQIAESFRSFTVLDYVLLGRTAWRPHSLWLCGAALPSVRRADREQVSIASDLIEKYNLSEFRNTQLRELPYGHQKLADIVRALAAEPRLLLLDEPTSGSSAEERLLLRDVMHELHAAKITTIIVDHEVGFISACCNRVLAMATGRQIGVGTPAEVLALPEVIDSYLGQR